MAEHVSSTPSPLNPRPRSRAKLLSALTREHILKGIELFNSGHPHKFGPSTTYDLLYEGHRYPPKAVVGLACLPLHGEVFVPDDFSGGSDSKCFAVLERNGFTIVLKHAVAPTADPDLLHAQARALLKGKFVPKPEGQSTPAKVERTTTTYVRDPQVVAFVLQRAGGECECCGEDAPFVDLDGEPFLEVHHIQPLVEQGPDVVENAAALCPNCHRECHHGQHSVALRERLKISVSNSTRAVRDS